MPNPMIRGLRWGELLDALAPFDPTPARRTALAILEKGGDARGVEESITNELVFLYGPWAAGWNWSNSEPQGGGPVHGWCCAPHNIEGHPPDSAMPKVVDALSNWRGVIGELQTTFAEIDIAATGIGDAQVVEVASSRLTALALARTHAWDAWYMTFAHFLSWYLDHRGWDTGSTRAAVDGVARARFQSWVEPDDSEVEATAIEVAALFAQQREVIWDATDDWRARRKRIASYSGVSGLADRRPRDGHLAFIKRYDAHRSEQRASRMEEAVAWIRSLAANDVPLTLQELLDTQQVVLGGTAALRETVAWAKAGTVRHGLISDEEMDRWLSDASGRDIWPIRAARVYLDVLFAHPFVDGNGRAARLALDYVLAREGMLLCTADPVYLIARNARDKYGPPSLANAIRSLAVPGGSILRDPDS